MSTIKVRIDPGNFQRGLQQAKRMGGTYDATAKIWTIRADMLGGLPPESFGLIAVGASAGGATRPRSVQPVLQPSEQYVSRPSRSRDDGYVVGTTYHMTRIPGGGGPDGLYWTVTACGKTRVTDAMDDTREGEWDCWAHVRPATDAEAAPVAARLTEAAARKAEGKALTTALRQTKGEIAELPTGSKEIWADHRMAGGEWWSLAPDGTLYFTHSDYDMGPTTWCTTAAIEQVERAKALGLKPGLI